MYTLESAEVGEGLSNIEVREFSGFGVPLVRKFQPSPSYLSVVV